METTDPAAKPQPTTLQSLRARIARIPSLLNPFGKTPSGEPTIFSMLYRDFVYMILFYLGLYVFLGLYLWAFLAIAFKIKGPLVPQ